MGRQIQLLLTKADTYLLLKKIREKCELVVLDGVSPSPTPIRLDPQRCLEEGRSWHDIYFARPEDVKDIEPYYFEKEKCWNISASRSPAMEFFKTNYHGSTIRAGRFYYVTGYYKDDGEFVQQPEAFVKWAEKIIRIARQNLTRYETFYWAGSEALQLLETGERTFLR